MFLSLTFVAKRSLLEELRITFTSYSFSFAVRIHYVHPYCGFVILLPKLKSFRRELIFWWLWWQICDVSRFAFLPSLWDPPPLRGGRAKEQALCLRHSSLNLQINQLTFKIFFLFKLKTYFFLISLFPTKISGSTSAPNLNPKGKWSSL